MTEIFYTEIIKLLLFQLVNPSINETKDRIIIYEILFIIKFEF